MDIESDGDDFFTSPTQAKLAQTPLGRARVKKKPNVRIILGHPEGMRNFPRLLCQQWNDSAQHPVTLSDSV